MSAQLLAIYTRKAAPGETPAFPSFTWESTRALVGVAIWIGLVIFFNRKTHPKALFFLFFAEFWERFSYYGMRALLVLYMTSQALRYTDKMAYGVYAAYGALVYATPILGGLIADKLLGYQKAILWGGLLMAFGHFAMAFEHEIVFYLALSLLILGWRKYKHPQAISLGTLPWLRILLLICTTAVGPIGRGCRSYPTR